MKLLLRLYGALAKPVLLYGAEIWGAKMAVTQARLIESCETYWLKCIMALPSSTPNAAVLLDFGKLPAHFDAKIKSIYLWLQLASSESQNLTSLAYKEQRAMADKKIVLGP